MIQTTEQRRMGAFAQYCVMVYDFRKLSRNPDHDPANRRRWREAVRFWAARARRVYTGEQGD